LEMHVAGDDIDVGVHDGDERLTEVLLRPDRTGGAQQTPVRRSLEPSLDDVGPHSHAFLPSACGRARPSSGAPPTRFNPPPQCLGATSAVIIAGHRAETISRRQTEAALGGVRAGWTVKS